MEFPEILKEEIEKRTDSLPVPEMKEIVRKMTANYKNSSGNGQSLIKTDEEAAVYSAVRMPATFAATVSALSHTLKLWNGTISSVIDAGAGTGAASWAFSLLTGASEYVCIEHEPVMRRLGKELMTASDTIISSAEWISGDIVRDSIGRKADAVTASYVLNELMPGDIERTAVKLWEAAEQLLLIVEPGTPAGFEVIKRVRRKLLAEGAYIVAPCMCMECPLNDDDWCHFTCRVARTRLHKLLKGGDVPYEDEKYSYIAFSRGKVTSGTDKSRILRHPVIQKGYVKLRTCTSSGLHDISITKKDGEMFRRARKSECGDTI